MKINIFKLPLYLIALSALFSSCEKTAVKDISTPFSGAQIKFYNFAVNSPGVNFYANNIKLTGLLSATGAESATGTLFGGLSPARGYVLAPAGAAVVFKSQTSSTMAVAAATGQGPNIETATLTASVEDGKSYTFYTSGVYDYTTKKSDAFIIEDKLPVSDTSQSYIRLVNPGHTTSTISLELTNVVGSGSTTPIVVTTPITGIAYKAASQFIAVKSGAYTLRVIDAASGKVVTRASTGLVKDRIYTFTLRGNLVSGTPAAFI
ncbi:MAG: DUF4397 domain-containing protein, partial [Pedobacter sp.]